MQELLGEPTLVAILPNDRWEHGDRYMTLEYDAEEASIHMVTCGCVWA